MSPRIYVAGHRGMVGSALIRRLIKAGYNELITRSRDQLNLLDQRAVQDFLQRERPDYIFVAAARVGGIHANSTRRGEFIYENLAIELNLLHGAHLAGTQHLLFLGSSCIYPRECPQPMREEHLLSGPLEPTNEPYAIAKIAGIKLCEAYRHQYGRDYVTLMPTNLYGPNDNYDLETSHVLPALIRKAHEAKQRNEKNLVVWGTGTPRREFLYVDDLAEACLVVMEHQLSPARHDALPSMLNVGVGEDISIRELAELVAEIVGFEGEIVFDASMPDGVPRKLLEISRIKTLGWEAKVDLRSGIKESYDAYLRSTQRLSRDDAGTA